MFLYYLIVSEVIIINLSFITKLILFKLLTKSRREMARALQYTPRIVAIHIGFLSME